MSLTVRQLIAEPSLELVLVAAATPAAFGRAIRWVAASDLVDPTPFLSGGELLLTTGSAIAFDDDDAWEAFVGRLLSVSTSAVGFATGLRHASVPPALARAAGAADLPLVEVLYHVPFVKITQFVADALVAGQLRDLGKAGALASRLATAITGGAGLSELLRQIAEEIEGTAAVLDLDGAVVASYPSTTRWEVEAALAGHRADEAELRVMPLDQAGVRDHVLVARSSLPLQTAEAVLSAASTLVAIDLSRRLAEEDSNADRMSRLLDALTDWTTPTATLSRAMRVAGLASDAPTLVLAAVLDGREQSVFSFRLRLAVQKHWSTVQQVRRGKAMLLLAQRPVPDTDAGLLEDLRHEFGKRQIVVAEPAADVDELRMAVAAARSRIDEATEPTQIPTYDLLAIVASAVGRGARRAAAHFLAPVEQHDDRYDSELVKTLRAYLRADGRPADAAAALHIHRNTLRYRLIQVEKLMGVDLQTLDGRTAAALALRLHDVGTS
ncbi:PucR family transcriptional regulator [Nocardioides pyridinolyticus]